MLKLGCCLSPLLKMFATRMGSPGKSGVAHPHLVARKVLFQVPVFVTGCEVRADWLRGFATTQCGFCKCNL